MGGRYRAPERLTRAWMSGSQGRYLRAFETGRLPESTCAHRLTASSTTRWKGWKYAQRPLEAETDTTLTMTTDHLLAGVRGGIERAAADGASGQLKRPLEAVVERILVESRACIQPYFVAPMVRTRIGSRRRADTHTNHGIPSGSLWITTRAWGRVV
jgi:hypothetical protein